MGVYWQWHDLTSTEDVEVTSSLSRSHWKHYCKIVDPRGQLHNFWGFPCK